MKSYSTRKMKLIFGETYTTISSKPDKSKVSAITAYAFTNQQEAGTVIHWND